MFYFFEISKGSTSPVRNRRLTSNGARKLTSCDVPHIRIINVFLLVMTTWLYAGAVQGASSSESSSLIPLNRFPRMVQEYFVKSVRRIEQQANQRRAALKKIGRAHV